MDGVLAHVWCASCLLLTVLVFLLSFTATLAEHGDCISYDEAQGVIGNGNITAYATANCDLPGQFHWWSGMDMCDTHSFVQLSDNTNLCGIGNQHCQVSPDFYLSSNNTFMCCAPNGLNQFDRIQLSDTRCTRIMVCPTVQDVSIPTIVTTNQLEKAYITVFSKPHFETPPFNLDLVLVNEDRMRTSISYTTRLIEPLPSSAGVVYVVEFMVNRDLVANQRARLHFESFFLNTENFHPGSCLTTCDLCEKERSSRIVVNTIEPTTSTTESPTTANPTLGGDLGCVAIGITAGIGIAMLVIGLLVGLIIVLSIWCCWCACKNKYYKKSGSFPCTTSVSTENPPPSVRPRLYIPQHSHVSTTSATTPTPTDQSRLLAGQTPTTQPFFGPGAELNPLHPQAISPYATTEDASRECKAYTTSVRGQASSKPVSGGNGFYTEMHDPYHSRRGNSPAHLNVPNGTTNRSASPIAPDPYAVHGEEIPLGRDREPVEEIIV